MNKARQESNALNSQTLTTAGTIASTGALMGPKGFIGPELTNDQLKEAIKKFEDSKNAANNFGGAVDVVGEKLKKMKEAVKEASDALTTRMTAALDDAKDKLKTAQAAFDDFATGTSKSLLEAFNFTDAMKEGA
jgi:hypothetical protein